jgi:hypothetical protein
MSIGPIAYLAAMRAAVAGPDVQRLASAYRQASVFLHEQRLTPDGAQRQLREVRGNLSGDWSAWEREVEAATAAALTKYGSGQLVWRDVCREIASALEAAAAGKTGVKR